jgi:hypothetical protein
VLLGYTVAHMTFVPAFPNTARAPGRRVAGIAVTLLLHVALLIGWKMAHRAPPGLDKDERSFIQWIRLPAPARPVARAVPAVRPRPAVVPAPAAPRAPLPVPAETAETAETAPAPAMSLVTPPAPPAPSAETILEKARRSAGAVDRALRKENQPYIVAPLDSPQIRMRKGMDKANALAPSRVWEAPKVEELVNQTGDGTRRDRVVGARGTYCITERATNTSVETIERHGKLRITNCPQHEDTANSQEWRTARD